MIFLSLLSRKVNQFAGFLGHFPSENIDSTPILAAFPRESEPYSCKFTALSPSYIPVQWPHMLPIGLTRRESEPYSHESRALSPGYILVQ